MKHPKNIGSASELIIQARLALLGKTTLTPHGDNQRYDLVIEENGVFKRIQCKTGNIRNGVIGFPTQSSTFHSNGLRHSYIGQIEYFAVYCPQNDKCYLIPIKDVPKKGAILRIRSPRNNQKKKIRWAKDYEL